MTEAAIEPIQPDAETASVDSPAAASPMESAALPSVPAPEAVRASGEPASVQELTPDHGSEPIADPQPDRSRDPAARDAYTAAVEPEPAVHAAAARQSLRLPVAAGAVAGAILGALVALIVPSLKGRSQIGDINSLSQRLATLERALGGADADRVQAMNDALLDHQKRLDAQREAMTAMNASMTTAISALRQASAASTSEAVSAFNSRLQKLEQSDQALTGSLRSVSSGQSANIGASLLSATQALASSFERGAPLASELRALESLSRKPEALAPLRAYAGAGAPTIAALSAEFAALRPALIAGETAPSGGSALDRLAASAGSLVKVRPVGEQAGADIASIYSRIEGAMRRADLDAVLREASTLSPKAAVIAGPWLDKVKARLAATAAIRGLENDALAIITESRK